MDRRAFLKRASLAGMGLGLGRALWAQPGPNDRIAVAVIGLGLMGAYHVEQLSRQRRVEVRAVCDVDGERLRQLVERMPRRPQGYTDYRELLSSETVDAVVIATPDHWHAPIALRAMRAGKDVYIEKPLAQTVAESRQVVAMAERCGRIVQVGLQQRASGHVRTVIELIRSGRLGKVELCRCWKGGGGAAKPVPDTAPPAGLDWDRWLGPAPWSPYNPLRCHTNWRWYWDYGGGLMTDWGVHLIDLAHWALGDDTPRSIEASGIFDATSSFETPTVMDVTYEYPSYHLGWSQNSFRGLPDEEYGVMFYGSRGKLFVNRAGYRILPEDLRVAPIGPADYELPRVRGQMDEFLDCVVSRRQPTCDATVGHASTTASHLGNVALRVGRKLTWDSAKERFVDDPEADRMLSRVARAPYAW